jgi:hypothetical protein
MNATGVIITVPQLSIYAPLSLIDIDLPSMERADIEMTDFSQVSTVAGNKGMRVFTPGKLIKVGEATVTIGLGDTALYPSLPVSTVPATISFAFKNAAGTTEGTWSFLGCLKGIRPSTPMEGRATIQATLLVSGPITIT